jgi:hypothetical protein
MMGNLLKQQGTKNEFSELVKNSHEIYDIRSNLLLSF